MKQKMAFLLIIILLLTISIPLVHAGDAGGSV